MSESMSKAMIRAKLQEAQIETAIGQKLAKLYNGYVWQVDCSVLGGIVTIKNLTLHGDWGFALNLRDLADDHDLNAVMIAGGELLERCNLPRTFRPEDFSERVTKDVRGNVIGDTSHATC